MHAGRAHYLAALPALREVGGGVPPSKQSVPRNKSDNPGRHAEYLTPLYEAALL